MDEFEALGMRDTLEREFADALCYFEEGKPVRLWASGPVNR